MDITCISDLHGFFPQLDGGDLLIVAGDLTAMDRQPEYLEFADWLYAQNYKKKVVIAGNHDGFLYKNPGFWEGCMDFVYLQDSCTKFKGMKIWGSPWTPTFYDWYFMLDRGAPLKAKWDLIPEDTDILVTHGPPYGVLDMCGDSKGNQFKLAGCVDLREAVERIQPKLHVFGHIHEQGGRPMLLKTPGQDIMCINASIMDECYDPVHKPMRVTL